VAVRDQEREAFWSAPAERSGDGAFAGRDVLEWWPRCFSKRRLVSLATAVQNAAHRLQRKGAKPRSRKENIPFFAPLRLGGFTLSSPKPRAAGVDRDRF